MRLSRQSERYAQMLRLMAWGVVLCFGITAYCRNTSDTGSVHGLGRCLAFYNDTTQTVTLRLTVYEPLSPVAKLQAALQKNDTRKTLERVITIPSHTTISINQESQFPDLPNNAASSPYVVSVAIQDRKDPQQFIKLGSSEIGAINRYFAERLTDKAGCKEERDRHDVAISILSIPDEQLELLTQARGITDIKLLASFGNGYHLLIPEPKGWEPHRAIEEKEGATIESPPIEPKADLFLPGGTARPMVVTPAPAPQTPYLSPGLPPATRQPARPTLPSPKKIATPKPFLPAKRTTVRPPSKRIPGGPPMQKKPSRPASQTQKKQQKPPTILPFYPTRPGKPSPQPQKPSEPTIPAKPTEPKEPSTEPQEPSTKPQEPSKPIEPGKDEVSVTLPDFDPDEGPTVALPTEPLPTEPSEPGVTKEKPSLLKRLQSAAQAVFGPATEPEEDIAVELHPSKPIIEPTQGEPDILVDKTEKITPESDVSVALQPSEPSATEPDVSVNLYSSKSINKKPDVLVDLYPSQHDSEQKPDISVELAPSEQSTEPEETISVELKPSEQLSPTLLEQIQEAKADLKPIPEMVELHPSTATLADTHDIAVALHPSETAATDEPGISVELKPSDLTSKPPTLLEHIQEAKAKLKPIPEVVELHSAEPTPDITATSEESVELHPSEAETADSEVSVELQASQTPTEQIAAEPAVSVELQPSETIAEQATLLEQIQEARSKLKPIPEVVELHPAE